MLNKPSILTIIGIVVISLFVVLPLLTISSIKNVWTTESNSINDIINDFTQDLSAAMNSINISSGSSNGTVINSGNNIVILSNGSSDTTSSSTQNTIVSNSGGGGIVTQVTSSNGVCNSNIVGGPRNDTISSTGVCNDQLTGGLGADKFVCGRGTDTVRDFNSQEGDIIIDRQNCETIL
ncbi:MAG TPA: hypothetical protein VFS97_11465 [Nitrososphaeraceae archaeon]|nr:hypothetical protein [Nitrososphaeraceae archaeon]